MPNLRDISIQFYGFSILPWHSVCRDDDGLADLHFAGWGPVQCHWYALPVSS
ncbi:MAG: hypothetical protein ACPGVT_11025 [Maricaulaceae bacterium]